MGTIVLDDLDRRIIQALYIDPRAPFSRLADVLGSSEQTVARRYRRLFDGHVLRVVGQLDSQRLGQSDWAVRIRCAPGSAPVVATKLAQRADTAWVQLISGGTEIFSTIRSRDRQERTPLLLGQLTVGRQIVAVEAYCLLHLFVTGSAPSLGASVLSRDEIEQLRSPPATRLSPDRSTAKLDESDWPLVPSPRRGRPRFVPEVGRPDPLARVDRSTSSRGTDRVGRALFRPRRPARHCWHQLTGATLDERHARKGSPRSGKRWPAAPRSPSLPPPPGPPTCSPRSSARTITRSTSTSPVR